MMTIGDEFWRRKFCHQLLIHKTSPEKVMIVDEIMWIAFGSAGDTANTVRSLYGSNLQFADRFCHEYQTPKVNSKCLQEYHSLRKQMDVIFDHQPKFLYSVGHSIGQGS